MKRRLVIYGLVMLALAATVAIVATTGPREPSHEGRPLSEWIQEATEGPEDQREQAIDAMLAMEPELFPWLVRMLEPRQNPLKDVLLKLTGRPSLFGLDLLPTIDRQQQALLAFEALGSAARPAIDLLEPRLYSRDGSSGASTALACIGIEALPVFARALVSGHQPARVSAAEGLRRLKGDPSAALPLLLKAAGDSEPLVRCAAVASLGRLRAEPEKVVPALVDRLKDPEALVRKVAVAALDECLNRTPDATVTLQRRLADSTNAFRPEVADALTRLTNRSPKGVQGAWAPPTEYAPSGSGQSR